MVISVRDLWFRYARSDTDVLRGLNFDVHDGEIFGFLGPNGSGKSTTQKVLTRILTHYTGHVLLFGREVRSLDAALYNQIGVSFEFPNLYEKLTAEENLAFYRDFFAVPTADPRRLLELFDLPVRDSRRVGEFSKGMKMRLVLARSLINRPKLWFLDEPTSGQDPQHAAQIRQLIRQQADAGVTVFLTTHDMTLADTLCDRVGFISAGSLVVVDSPRRLKLQHHTRVVRVEYATSNGSAREDFRLDDPAFKRAFVDAVLTRPVETIHALEPSLEEVFLKVTGHGLS